MNKNKLFLLKPAALAVLNSTRFRLNSTNQKPFLFHSTPALSSRRRPYYYSSEGVYRAPKRRYKNFVRGFSNPLWKRILLRDPSAPSNGPVQNDYYYYTPYSSQSSSWFGQDYQATRSNAFGGSNSNHHWSSWNWRNQNQGKDDPPKKSDNSTPEMTSERLALGLSASGPLTLEEVKNAYHACAMKWHPDHNQGLFKTVAEEKFKSCKAAYESLCDYVSSK
ncbi:unnamed protein product [Coffea canephora]|uniref:J domain-containing protein n=1 Tax=Coffea canephora TaxID=49390 RepID=A0A068UNY5_COFCA|nr:unnamed protein product [Coffea canephora]